MIWWFLVLALSAGAALWAGMASYLRVRRHMTAPDVAIKDPSADIEHEQDTSHL